MEEKIKLDSEINTNTDSIDKLNIVKTIEPIIIKYCDYCRFPEEYCEYSHQIYFKKIHSNEKAIEIKETKDEATKTTTTENESKSNQEPISKTDKKKQKDNFIMIELSKRGKKKFVTYVFNLEKFGLNLKETAKLFSKKFACSSTVTKEENGQEGITLTGEFGYDIVDFLCEKFPIIKPEMCKVKEPKEKEK